MLVGDPRAVEVIDKKFKRWGNDMVAGTMGISVSTVRAIMRGQISECQNCGVKFYGCRKYCGSECHTAKPTETKSRKDLLQRADQSGALLPLVQSLRRISRKG